MSTHGFYEFARAYSAVLPYLVVCDQIGRFQSLLVGRFSVRSLVVFWSFLGFLAIPFSNFEFLAKLNFDNFVLLCFDKFIQLYIIYLEFS
jgi:hypothetical protein